MHQMYKMYAPWCWKILSIFSIIFAHGNYCIRIENDFNYGLLPGYSSGTWERDGKNKENINKRNILKGINSQKRHKVNVHVLVKYLASANR